MSTTNFAVMWDCYGLEAIEEIPNPSLTTFAILKGTAGPKPPNIMHWKLRAQSNPQRNYEIYIFSVDETIDKELLVEQFKNDPQHMADLIRSRGHCYYSDRLNTKVRSVI